MHANSRVHICRHVKPALQWTKVWTTILEQVATSRGKSSRYVSNGVTARPRRFCIPRLLTFRQNVGMAQWTPRGADPAAHHVLVDGVPQYMHESMKAWVAKQLQWPSASGWAVTYNIELMREYDLDAKGPWSMAKSLQEAGPVTLFEALKDDQRLDLVDWLLHRLRPEGGVRHGLVREMDEILTRGSSMWTIGERSGNPGLVRRVPEGVQAATEAVIAGAGSAGALLAQAWSSLYGRVPDFEEAYEKAIKAVEEAGVSTVCPNNPMATLGTMARDMENQGNWRLETAEDPKHQSADTPYKMVQSLWAGQESRHGGNGYRSPTQGEAESAVMLAVPLVQWFTSGVVARR